MAGTSISGRLNPPDAGCHGLLCLATETRIHLFNPSTRHLVALPADGGETAGFGIGYLSPAKGHVVVRLNIPRQSRTSLSWKLECSVFTFLPENGGPRWRDGGGTAARIWWSSSVFRHWRPETHRQWRSPVRNSTQLVELRGHLYLVETAAFSYVAVWKLSDPGNSMWSKACTIDISKFDPSFVGEIQCVKGTEIIFNSCTSLLLYYDEKNKTYRRKMLPCSAANLTIYCESLTFPATQQEEVTLSHSSQDIQR
ncbi:hypothetical protein OIU78_022792 [Salix suchowensis]|nr:hypothetical protein OIU78_022792 [Salix suchowensis]